jgi:mevalonate kinase
MVNQYPGKLLFFGEYTIIHGSLALALPYPYFNGAWNFENNSEKTNAISSSRASLIELLSYLKSNSFDQMLDLELFQKEIDSGIWFESNIPNGYGCGSSGAVCAGIYDRYARQKAKDSHRLQKELAAIEGFFHGQSSGLDPLVCYLNQPILIGKDGPSVINDYKKEEHHLRFFLIDTQMPRKTTPLVQHYMQLAAAPSFQQECIDPLKQLNAIAIDQFLNESPDLYSSWQEIGRLEFQHLLYMIPEAFQAIWEAGLKTDAPYALKLCGAGGGGFILGITTNWELSQEALKGFQLIAL